VTFRQSLALLLVMWTTGACARALPPSGGQIDPTPPRVLTATPEPFAVLPGFNGRVVFRFDKRISERLPAELVLVSPATSRVRWQRGRQEIRVWLEDGWQPGQIYRVELAPGVRDLFGNVSREPVELVFSTGPEIPATAVAGIVTDRISGRAPLRGLVEAVRQEDNVLHRATADSSGFFALRSLPLGTYHLRAFDDANRNHRVDPNELRSSYDVVALRSDTDTATVFFGLLPPDTLPARLLRAEAVDSMTVTLTFSSYFDTAETFDDAAVRLFAMPDSVEVAAGGRLLTPATFEPMRVAARDTAERRAADAPARPRREPLPLRDLVLLLDAPLRPGQEYVLEVSGVTTIQGVRGGGGATRFRSAARVAPVMPPDTLR
jgi:hypothetical protein